MTEADEVAANMLAPYLAWRNERYAQGKIYSRPCDYVMQELSATESYTVIDAVTAALEVLVNVS